MTLISAITLFLGLAATVAILYLLTRRVKSGKVGALRAHDGYKALDIQVARAIEGGRKVHFGLGIGSLTGTATASSVSGLLVLDHLARNASAAGLRPMVTTGDATLFPVARDSLRAAGARFHQRDFSLEEVAFLADSAFPMTYAAGASEMISENAIGSNLLVGRFGPELALVSEAAARENMAQIIGTDDLSALGVAAVMTDQILVGEELFAAGAYLEGDASHRAGLQLQDVARIAAAAAVGIAALVQLFIG